MFSRVLRAVAVLVVAAAPAAACLWDRDTLRYEAAGLPGVVEVISGRIVREPALYYEMRLERVAKEIEADGGLFDRYDDAGVACDRLGRSDEAVEWMARKRAAMERVNLDTRAPALRDAWYRYHANLGTFLAHRWIRGGAKRESMEDLKKGREEIAAAVAINPEAHFGREKYQLAALDFIIAGPEQESGGLANLFQMLPDAERPRGPWKPKSQAKAVEGLVGLIALGSAWESLDVFYALSQALERQGDAYIARFAQLRCEEIVKGGGRSLDPENKPWDEKKTVESWLLEAIHDSSRASLEHGEEVTEFYPTARREAEAWRKEREEFMVERLKAGRHPDTDPRFWDGYVDRPAPTPPGSLVSFHLDDHPGVGLALIGLIPVGVVTVWLGGKWVVRRVRTRAA